MLVLARKRGESIVINGEIIVKVVRVSGGSIRLGIDAPAHMTIVREELDKKDNSVTFVEAETAKS